VRGWVWTPRRSPCFENWENVVVDLGGTIIIDHFHFPTAFEALLKTSG